MRWERAKSLMLVFFALLNIFLGYMLYQEQRRYVLSPEQEHAIRAMFAQHNISWYIHFIRHFPPMRPLQVEGYDYDRDALLDMFELRGARMETGGGDVARLEYVLGEARLVISNGYISYANPSGLDPWPGASTAEGVFTAESAAESVKRFAARHFPGFTQDYVLPAADTQGYYVFYREAFGGHIIHSNFIECLVTENGITQVDMKYGSSAEYQGAANEICAPDEALFTFIQRVRSIWPDIPVLIERMDLVYYQSEIRPRQAAPLPATPYYRIFIDGSEMPFMINAYTNVCEN